MVKLESETELKNCFSLDKACQLDNYLKNLLEIIETHPSESASQFGKSIIYYILDDYDKMLDYLEPLSASFPNLPLLHRRIAEACVHQNKFSKAVNHLEKAVEINDKDLTAKVWLILLYFKLGKSKQANINFQELTEFVFVLDVSEKSFTGL